MKKRALWIFDDDYVMLTYLSVCSFIEHCDVIVTLICCSNNMNESDRQMFLDLDTEVEIYHFEADVTGYESHLRAHILNRLARLHFTREFENDLLFMIDSDVAFAASLKMDLQEIDVHFNQDSAHIPLVSGVTEFLSATDAYLYFKKKDQHGYTRKTPEDAKVDTYRAIYGDDWKSLVQGFQFNNGFLIFYKARPLIDQWEKYYLEGLKYNEINPLDDQVPLAAAIQKTNCTYWNMQSKWNSLGDLDGNFTMFHAWGGEWKIEIDQVLRNQKATSAYGEICKKYLVNCPEDWILKFNDDLKSFPYRFRHITGAFDHGTVFSDVLHRLHAGHIVEVGTYKGRSACFMAELIKASGKNIKFESIDHFERSDTSLQIANANLSKAGVKDAVKIIKADSLYAAKSYNNEELDFVFLDTDSPPQALTEELEAWYDKIKEGGVLAGYDHTIHDTVFKAYDCASVSFCEKNKIPLRTYEYQFLIQKPYKTIS